jgi:hypothetical protein
MKSILGIWNSQAARFGKRLYIELWIGKHTVLGPLDEQLRNGTRRS